MKSSISLLSNDWRRSTRRWGRTSSIHDELLFVGQSHSSGIGRGEASIIVNFPQISQMKAWCQIKVNETECMLVL